MKASDNCVSMTTDRCIVFWLGLILFASNPQFCFGEVSLKNGNFFIAFTDIEYGGGLNPKVERVYNSKTGFAGRFGVGWGWQYEVYLSPTADGGAVIHEYGGGAENIFVPDKMSSLEIRKTAERLVDIAVRLREVEGEPAKLKLLQQVADDEKLRNQMFERYLASKEILPPSIPIGTQMHSERFSHQRLTRTSTGYERVLDDGKSESYDSSGHLTRVTDRNGNYIDLSYDTKNVVRLTDNLGRSMIIHLNPRGLIERIDGSNERWSQYIYDDKNNMSAAKTSEGEDYKYQYDARHNLTSIVYTDKSEMRIQYYPRELYDNVKKVDDRDGTTTEYAYAIDPKDDDHYTVSLQTSDKGGNVISKSTYEYFNKQDSEIGTWTQRLVTEVDGDMTTTTYERRSGLPLSIVRGTEETKFQYDSAGHVIRKETPLGVTTLEYSPTVGKVTKVTVFDKSRATVSTWSTFEYDDKGNLRKASNDGDQIVTLDYDALGRIAAMHDGPETISFTYNMMSKPESIVLSEHGSAAGQIGVQYSPNGEIAKVESPEGRKTAIAITTEFQKLLEIIRPAGVSLSF